MSKSDNMEQMYQDVKPQYPDSQGRQYADGPVQKLAVTYNQDYSEIAEDRTNHANTTPEMGSWNWSGNQYSTDFGGGESKSYGTSVTTDGRTPVESTTVDNSRADRGKEA